MKLLCALKNKPICNDFHYILFGLVILIISIRCYVFLCLLVLYIIFIYKKIRYIVCPLIIIFILFLGSYCLKNKENPNINNYSGIFLVEDINDNYYILNGEYKIICYIKNENINVGDILDVSITIYDWDLKSYEEEFDYKQYYKEYGIDYKGVIKSYKVIGKKFTFNIIKNKFCIRYL